MSEAFILAGRRTPVAARNGAFSDLEVFEIGAPVVSQVMEDAGIQPTQVDEVILGNGLYGGGNPARIVALSAGLPERVASVTIDTQCCSGLDAIALAEGRIRSGKAAIIIAGGVESYSRSPIRQRRPKKMGESPKLYTFPPFTPWPDRDPDMIESAAELAARNAIDRKTQEDYAVQSHRRARADKYLQNELVPIKTLKYDEFTRELKSEVCARLKPLAGDMIYGVTAATTAIEADGAAVVIIANRNVADGNSKVDKRVKIISAESRGNDPNCAALAPITVVKEMLGRLQIEPSDIDYVEMMEAFSVQAIACIEGIGFLSSQVNQRGGALARGHPIGASGAILAVRLFHDLLRDEEGKFALATIAAAGGLGSALLLKSTG